VYFSDTVLYFFHWTSDLRDAATIVSENVCRMSATFLGLIFGGSFPIFRGQKS